MNKVVEDLLKRRDRIDEQIAKIRSTCNHPNIDAEYKSNTGNWCPQDDSYWIDITCHDCGARITIDSEDERYRTYSHGRNVNVIKR